MKKEERIGCLLQAYLHGLKDELGQWDRTKMTRAIRMFPLISFMDTKRLTLHRQSLTPKRPLAELVKVERELRDD